VDTFPIVTVDEVRPVVLVNADVGIGARYAPADDDVDAEDAEDEPVLLELELFVEEQAVSVPPPMASTASTSAPRRRMPLPIRGCSERSIRMVFPLIGAALRDTARPGTAPHPRRLLRAATRYAPWTGATETLSTLARSRQEGVRDEVLTQGHRGGADGSRQRSDSGAFLHGVVLNFQVRDCSFELFLGDHVDSALARCVETQQVSTPLHVLRTSSARGAEYPRCVLGL
jgi:hypothetical protein